MFAVCETLMVPFVCLRWAVTVASGGTMIATVVSGLSLDKEMAFLMAFENMDPRSKDDVEPRKYSKP